MNFFGRLSYICTSLGPGVSVISVSTESSASQSYRSKLWFKGLIHISRRGKPYVSIISVSIGSVWRSHIRHPLYKYTNQFNWRLLSRFYRLKRFQRNEFEWSRIRNVSIHSIFINFHSFSIVFHRFKCVQRYKYEWTTLNGVERVIHSVISSTIFSWAVWDRSIVLWGLK